MRKRHWILFILSWLLFSPIFGESKNEFIVLEPSTSLYLFPDKKSEVLRKLSFGEILNSENLRESKSKFRLLTDRDGLKGWADSGSLFRIGSRGTYNVITKAVERLLYQDSGVPELESVFSYLTGVEEGTVFRGDEFLFLKIRRLVVLQKYLEKLQSAEVRAKTGSKLEDLLKKFPSEIGIRTKEGTWTDSNTNSKEGSRFRVRPEAFWRIAESNPNSKPGDFAAYLAVKNTPEVKCGPDPICVLQDEQSRRLKYLGLNPNGNYSQIFSSQIDKRLQHYVKDRETFLCDTKLPKAEILSSFRKTLQELPYRYGKKFHSKWKIIQEECGSK
ncbi:SH3 domain-containing protein [Leptospira fluminis]|uniref:SH3 domain-containing protein n=1 Tax=Leptospira fluminis TaxID=2484979 RepID=A0A4R9GKK8_9LEPT|nr:SH3 domain-containing protein [Leptospira fluminis]TGK14724.1 SH3 domain-containing protein [Leptospira fluminis]